MTQSNSTPLLSVRDLSVTFTVARSNGWPWSKPNVVHAVNGVSFDLEAGKCLGIVGESGCGKSTLIRAIAGLVSKSGGEIEFDGQRVDTNTKSDLQQLRRSVQMIFQDPVASLNPRMTVYEIVEEPSKAFFPERSAEEHREAVMSLLDRVGIPRRNANRYPHEFSGGQCQRVGIARALAAKPRVLLCDEPVSALDVSIQAQIINLLRELQAEMGLTLVFVAHDIGIVRHISDDILVMYLGGKMEYGPAHHVVHNPLHPYSQALLSAVPVADPRVQVVPQILEGDLPSPIALPVGCLFETRCPKAVESCRHLRPDVVETETQGVACSQVF
jgi:oligopeptide transport system ATP-binding protein